MTLPAALPPYSVVSPLSHGNSALQVPESQIHKQLYFLQPPETYSANISDLFHICEE